VLNRQCQVFGNIPNHPAENDEYVFRPPFDIRLSGGEVLDGQFDLFRKIVMNSYDEFALRTNQSWFVRTDIRSYFPSVDHVTLERFLLKRRWLADVTSRELLLKCLRKWASEEGKGIPIGYECSDYLGNLYVRDLDYALKDFRAHRYVDDIYIFVEDFEAVKDVLYRIDKTLKSLGLQRNTSKTMIHPLEEYGRDQFELLLSTNLSMYAEERPGDVAEQDRQRELLKILQESFDPHTDDVLFSSKIKDIRRVAFVLYRLSGPGENIEELAYEILDYDLKYAYHALSYLYLNHFDERLERKLNSILLAEYEPRALKALALAFISKVKPSLVRFHLQQLTEGSNEDDWHLVRAVLQDAIEPEFNSYSPNILQPLLKSENPFVQVYAFWLHYQFLNDNDQRSKQAQRMFTKNNHLVKKLGLYLTFRDGLVNDVDASLLDPPLQTLFPKKTQDEIENFRNEFDEVFGIPIDPDFPIGSYFGSMTLVAQCMREIYAIHNTDATKFVRQMHRLMVFMVTTSAGKIHGESCNMEVEGALNLFDDEQLNELVADVADQIVKKHVRVSKKNHLSGYFIRVFSEYVDSWHKLEGLRVRNIMFISYSVEDVAYREKLVTAIKSYFGQDPPLWYFQENLEFSDDIEEEILKARAETKVAILLTSNNYFASSPIMRLEYPYFKDQRDKKNLRILWIPCKPSSAVEQGLGRVWTPAGKDPLSGKSDHDQLEALDKAAKALYEYMDGITEITD